MKTHYNIKALRQDEPGVWKAVSLDVQIKDGAIRVVGEQEEEA